ncbi:hypothetical protein ACE6H2_015583 [Prunus campanulata]
MLLPKFWARSEINRGKKLDNSGSKAVRSELEWLVYCIVLRLDFNQNSPHDSSHHIMMMPKFWSRSEINRCTKLDTSSSKAVCSELELLVYSVVLAIGFHSKHTKRLLPTYYDDAQVLGSIRNL